MAAREGVTVVAMRSLALWVACLLMLAAGGASAAPPPAPRLTIHLERADIHNVLRLLADVSRLNLVAGEDVHGRVTLHLRNVLWREAFAAVLASQGLGSEKMGSI